jgi:hypothetical protein
MKLFLSYTKKDSEQVRKLAHDLRDQGVSVWLDEWEIKVGDSITQKIQKGIKDSDYLAVWLSTESVRSGWVEREWQAKYQEEIKTKVIKVLPLLGEKCKIPIMLADKRYADFSSSYEAGLRELVEGLLATMVIENRNTLMTRARNEFRIAEDSYGNLVRDLTTLLKQQSTLGLHAALGILNAFHHDLNDRIETVTQVLAMNPRLKLPTPEQELRMQPYKTRLLSKSCHALVARYGFTFVSEINPYSLRCGYHPLIHVTASLLVIQEHAGDKSIPETQWKRTLKQLFYCIDFWLAFLRECHTTHAPQERLVRELLLACAAVHRALKGRRVPTFLKELNSDGN